MLKGRLELFAGGRIDFGDRLMDAADDPAAIEAYRSAFPPAYETNATPAEALADIAVFREVGDGVAVRLSPPIPTSTRSLSPGQPKSAN